MSFIVFYELNYGDKKTEEKIGCFDVDVRRDVTADDILSEIRKGIKSDNYGYFDYTVKSITKVNEIEIDVNDRGGY